METNKHSSDRGDLRILFGKRIFGFGSKINKSQHKHQRHVKTVFLRENKRVLVMHANKNTCARVYCFDTFNVFLTSHLNLLTES